jgi:hypothetical protein
MLFAWLTPNDGITDVDAEAQIDDELLEEWRAYHWRLEIFDLKCGEGF